MTDGLQRNHDDSPIEGAPVWVRALQAAIVGIAAGLVLHMLLSLVVLQGQGLRSGSPGPAECKKSSPARETGVPAPPRGTPSVRAAGGAVVVPG